MEQVLNLTSNARQTMQLPLENGETATFNLYFHPTQYAWYFDIIYNDYLYFCPKGSVIVAFINCCLIIFSSFLINKNTIKKRGKRNGFLLFRTIPYI